MRMSNGDKAQGIYIGYQEGILLLSLLPGAHFPGQADLGPSAPILCHSQNHQNIRQQGRHFQLEKLDGDAGKESMMASLHQSLGYHLLLYFPHCQISVITWGILFVSVSHACQGPRSAVLLHCLMSISFLLWDLESVSSEDTPYPELGTQALHFSLETWIHSPQESITIQAVSSSARIETARKCSV